MCKLLILLAIAICLYSTFRQQSFVQSLSLITEEGAELLRFVQNKSKIKHESVQSSLVVWPSEVPYEIDSSITGKQNCTIHSVLYNVMLNSCIRFRPKKSYESGYVSITRHLACDTVHRKSDQNGGNSHVCYSVVNMRQTSRSTTSAIQSNPLKDLKSKYKKLGKPLYLVMVESSDFDSIQRSLLKALGGYKDSTLDTVSQLYMCPNYTMVDWNWIKQFVDHHQSCNSHNESTINFTNNIVNKTRKPRNVVIDDNERLWPDGVIPYELDSRLEKHRCLLESGMLQIMLNSCVRFRRRTPEDQFYMDIFGGDSCYATIGYDDMHANASVVSLHDKCANIGSFVHELMHPLGFYHLHNRPDRDTYLNIHMENVDSANLHILNSKSVKLLTPWDYSSVMLYGGRAFGKNGSITMSAKTEGVVLENVYDKPGLSQLDAIAINRLYQCAPNGRLKQNFYENADVIESFGEIVKSCSPNEPLLFYIFSADPKIN